jgi:CubicO group peptidase (beta-lactamase class C family)
MTHSGGFSYGFNYKHPVDRAYILAGFADMKDQISSDAFINKLKDIPLITKPGTTWRYGLNYDVLGVVLERAAQRPLDVLLAEYVTKPLKLADVAFYVPSYKASRLPPMDVAAGGDAPYNVQPMNEHYDPPFKSGGAGLYASASDYLRIGQMLVNGGELYGVRILSEESVGEMTRNQLPATELPYQLSGFFGHAFGLGVDVCTPDEANPGRPEGEVSWGGYAQTQWFISGGPNVKGTENDKQTVLVLMSQHAPINDKLTKVVKPAFYEALRLGSSSKKSGANEKKKNAAAAATTAAAATKHSFLRQGPRMGGRE